MLAEVTGTVAFGKATKGKQRLEITDMDGNKHEFLITKDKQVLVHDGQVVNKGEMIVDGPADAPRPSTAAGSYYVTQSACFSVQERKGQNVFA
jgi:hypothetical protein